MKNIIKIENLVFEYKREDDAVAVRAVDNVTLDIERGSFTAIIGRNGSGKSTLAKNLNALLLPDSGAVYINGYNTADEDRIWEIRQTAGMVFQNPDNQLVSSIVEDDVAFGPENLGIESKEIRERVDESLISVNMYDERKKAPHLLSGGQKQRVAIAGVVAMRPKCIIFDEPTAMLDPHGRKEVLDIIDKLNGEGITILLITHFMEEAAKADRVIIMDKGRIVLSGTPEEVFAKRDEIRSMNLDVPFAVDIAHRLRSGGIPVPVEIIEDEGLSKYLIDNKDEIEKLSITPPVFEECVRVRKEYLSPDPAVKATDLVHIYGQGTPYETIALEGINFTIEKGTFAGIIGHTGSGKSTLIQHLNGLLKPHSGKVHIDGLDITDKEVRMRDIRRKIGLVFQYPEYQLFEETVAKDIAFGPSNLGLPQEEIARRVRESLELVGLDFDEISERSPFDLSGGQKRRVAIAGVLAMRPEVLILDEPTAGLDPKAHKDILNLIRKVHEKEGNTIILVSHNMGDIAELADQVLVMDQGRLVMNGTPEEVFSQAHELHRMGLGLPSATEFIELMRLKGAEMDPKALTACQAEREIFKWIGKN
jgi:energy-coupling factor transporter ATPase